MIEGVERRNLRRLGFEGLGLRLKERKMEGGDGEIMRGEWDFEKEIEKYRRSYKD